ncbi:germination protein XA [Paenibacillus chitinolyticus]|uniref:Ger(x)C family spore germination protein n=1 Tax=Paenibacillus chitinolyticus TaxID=79263 RepID=UPI0026E4F78C|nr:Ger(x)C family spore germination protein [Paenibacillus chitinolyticus]GKS09716.1 germination protein XA [Paenibacillus chitinolyticus]
MKIRRLCLLALVTVLAATGCVERRIFERIGLVVALGYDKGQGSILSGTSVMYTLDKESGHRATILANQANTTKKLREDQNRKSSKKLMLGQLRVVLYEEAIARDGLIDLIDSLIRDPSIGTKIYLGVSTEKSADLLQYPYRDIRNIGTYLYDTIKQNVLEGQLISPTLHEFLRDYYTAGKDPVLPVFVRKGETIATEKAALFQFDKMVGMLSNSDAAYLKLIRNRFKAGTFELKLDKKKLEPYLSENSADRREHIHVVVRIVDNKQKIRLTDWEKPAYELNMNLKFALEEISVEINLTDPEVTRTIEKLVTDEFTKKMESVLSKMMELKTDPVGFGEIYRQSHRGGSLTKSDWYDKMSSMSVDVHLNMEMLRTGVVE